MTTMATRVYYNNPNGNDKRLWGHTTISHNKGCTGTNVQRHKVDDSERDTPRLNILACCV